MPQTTAETYEGQIIAGVFSDRQCAERAVLAFRQLNIPSTNIQLVDPREDGKVLEANDSLTKGHGFSKSQALYYSETLRAGKVLVVVYEADRSAPIIDIFDRYKAEYNPNGSRNVREDVLGMTAGAVAGAAVGAALGGPAGIVAGAAIGAVMGGGAGAVIGKDVEHRK